MNVRNTKQRRAIFEAIENQGGHPTADEIYMLVKRRDLTLIQPPLASFQIGAMKLSNRPRARVGSDAPGDFPRKKFKCHLLREAKLTKT